CHRHIYHLSLHDALPISHHDDAGGRRLLIALVRKKRGHVAAFFCLSWMRGGGGVGRLTSDAKPEAKAPAMEEVVLPVGARVLSRSEEHTSELQSRENLVC